MNNDGISIYAPLRKLAKREFKGLMNIHLKGPFFLTQRLLPFIQDGGRIVNISTGLVMRLMPR